MILNLKFINLAVNRHFKAETVRARCLSADAARIHCQICVQLSGYGLSGLERVMNEKNHITGMYHNPDDRHYMDFQDAASMDD